MTFDESPLVADVSSAWVQALVAKCQVLTGIIAEAPLPGGFGTAVNFFALEIPNPRNPAEYFVQRSFLLELALTLGAQLHREIHGPLRHNCTFDSSEVAIRVWRDRSKPPRELLTEWVNAVTEGLAGDHQEFQDAQRWVAAHFVDPLRTSDIARRFNIAPRKLNRSFKTYLGVSLKKYHQGVRLVKALEMLLLGDLKVEAIALSVGFRSKKTFYAAFDAWFQMTPGEARLRKLKLSDKFNSRIPVAFRPTVRAILTDGENLQAAAWSAKEFA